MLVVVILRVRLFRAYDQMKSQADTIRLEKSFEIGKWVIVKLCAHRQQSIVTHIHAKLDARYYGPYPIVAHVGAVAYKLKLLEGSRVHPVFHVSLLKKAIGNYKENEDWPDNLEGDVVGSAEPDTVLAFPYMQREGEEVGHVLVQ